MNVRAKISSKGQLVLPKAIRDEFGLEPGCEVDIESVGKGIMLTPHPKRSRRVYALDEVAGMLKYDGQPVSVEDMNRAIEKEAIRMWNAKRR